jgi:amino acid adenylation domain-containing protein
MKKSVEKIELFSRIWTEAKKNPDRTILMDREGSLTWREFLTKAEGYAEQVKSARSKIIPILTSQTVETPSAILGCLMAGKGFAPLSLQQPEERLQNCLKRLEADVVVSCDSEQRASKSITLFGLKALYSDGGSSRELPSQPKEFDESDILYVLFTSGSTGVPKGVRVDAGNLQNTLFWSQDVLDWNSRDVMGGATKFFFDISIFDLFSLYYYGIPFAIFSDTSNVSVTLDEIQKWKVTSIFSVPVFFSQLSQIELSSEKRLNSLRRIISGGDFFPPSHMLRWLDKRSQVEVLNVWGPTESSVVNTMHSVTKSDRKLLEKGKCPSVGKAHPRMEITIVNEKMEVIEPGEVGEILMIGRCVTRGYLGDAETTKKAYISFQGKPAFRTGDLGHFDVNGELYIVGRMGSMVKISGYRVDLGEIENIVSRLEGVHFCAAFVQEEEFGVKEIWLGIEPKNQTELSIFDVKQNLRKMLPTYMVPKRVILFKELPKNQNNKIDRKAAAIQAREMEA